jgi:hypothetical protein
MIKKFADHFNPMNEQQLNKAKPSFTPGSLKSLVKKFHPASTKPNTEFTNEAKKMPTSGVPKTKWWSKMEKAQLN